MAELVWKGKHSTEQQQARYREIFINAKENTHQLYTYETSGGQPAHSSPNSPLPTAHNWHNRLIQGDKSAVLPALLAEFAEQVNLVYIDPPFMTGRDFKTKSEVAFSDKWDNNLDAYLQWLYETLVLLKFLLAPHGSLYVHLDWRVTHYARVILDEVFGFNSNTNGPGFQNEIIWHRPKASRSSSRLAVAVRM